MYENARYVRYAHLGGAEELLVDINGTTWSIPLDPANSDYQRIMALVAEGKLVIAPAE